MSFVIAGAIGLALGVVTGIPLSVANVAIVDAAVANRRRFAFGMSLGVASADTVHATLAFVGVGRLVTSRPELVKGMAIAAAVLIVTYAVLAWRARPEHRPPDDDSRAVHGYAAGLSLTLPNPLALTAWVAVAASLLPDASVGEAAAIAAGVGVGSAAWFVALVRWVAKIRPDHPALRVVPRVALLVIVGIAAIGLWRTLGT
jgi:threonine/homoserine/homoserine lactone efflux protein